MTYKFFDVKQQVSCQLEVIEKMMYGTRYKSRYALKALTADGRKVVTFCNKDTFDKFTNVKVTDNRKG